MKNIVVFYIAILIPFPFSYQIDRSGYQIAFAILLLVYAFPYRALTDGMRLVSKNLMTWPEVWKLLIPGSRLGYTRALYFSK